MRTEGALLVYIVRLSVCLNNHRRGSTGATGLGSPHLSRDSRGILDLKFVADGVMSIR